MLFLDSFLNFEFFRARKYKSATTRTGADLGSTTHPHNFSYFFVCVPVSIFSSRLLATAPLVLTLLLKNVNLGQFYVVEARIRNEYNTK